MNRKANKLSPLRIFAIILIGLAMAFFSFLAIVTMIGGYGLKEKTPYLFGS